MLPALKPQRIDIIRELRVKVKFKLHGMKSVYGEDAFLVWDSLVADDIAHGTIHTVYFSESKREGYITACPAIISVTFEFEMLTRDEMLCLIEHISMIPDRSEENSLRASIAYREMHNLSLMREEHDTDNS